MKLLKTTRPHPLVLLPFTALFMLGTAPAEAGYPELILSNNPVAYYRLEELPGATVAVDSSPSGFDANYIYNVASNSPALGLPGITTNSTAFNGGANFGFVLIPFHQELSPVADNGSNGAPFSVEVWAQPTSRPADYASVLGMFGAYGVGIYSDASGWNFAQTPGPTGVWLFNMKHGPFAQAGGVPINLLQWYHLAATYNGTNVIFYVNGVAQVADTTTTYLADNGADGQIGVTQNAGIPPYAPFSGGVDEVAFYTNVLTAAEILAHYQLGTNSIRQPPTPPGFLQQPESRTNFSGTTASFSVVANGTQPLNYQWHRGASAIPNATNSSYSLLATYPADNGATFFVTVTNVVGSSNSAVATLTVLTNLDVVHQPYGPITRNVGSKAAFRVVATGAAPITYQWRKVAGGVTNTIANATNDTLWLSNVQLADNQSEYFAHLVGPFTSTDTANAQLLVQTRPVTVSINGYANVVIADDPVAFWRLDETNSSSIVTDAVGSFDGIYLPGPGAITYETTNGIPGNTNAAISITGGATVQIPYALEINPVSGPWSFEAWIRPDTHVGDFRTPLSSMYVVPGAITGWNVYQHAGSAWTMNMFKGTFDSSFNSDFFDIPLVLGAWYHLVISDDLTTIRFIVNGVERASLLRNTFGFVPNGINGDPAVAGGPTILGQRSDFAFSPFDGGVDDVAVYNHALTAEQARLHFLSSTKLTAATVGGNIQITWPVGTLQAASNVEGVYTNVTGATSPYNVPATDAKKFFRVRVQP